MVTCLLGEFPQGCQIENRPLELDTECNKWSRKIEHWLECRHLFGRLDAIPEADVRHCVVRAVDADVIAQVSAHRADTGLQRSFAFDQFGLDNRGFVGIEGPQRYPNDRCCHIPLPLFLLRRATDGTPAATPKSVRNSRRLMCPILKA